MGALPRPVLACIWNCLCCCAYCLTGELDMLKSSYHLKFSYHEKSKYWGKKWPSDPWTRAKKAIVEFFCLLSSLPLCWDHIDHQNRCFKGVVNTNNDECNPFSHSQYRTWHVRSLTWLTQAHKWNAGIVNVISYTWAFLIISRLNICCEIGLFFPS